MPTAARRPPVHLVSLGILRFDSLGCPSHVHVPSQSHAQHDFWPLRQTPSSQFGANVQLHFLPQLWHGELHQGYFAWALMHRLRELVPTPKMT
jgi:hypothetical protein